MDEKTAWRIFCSTGKIDDYMRYSKIKTKEENVAMNPSGNVIEGEFNGNQNRWNSNQGTNYR